MKKIYFTTFFILSMFLFDIVNAQNGAQGSGQSFNVTIYVNAPYYCPDHGVIEGYIPILGHSVTEYFGTTNNPYQLYWVGIFFNYQPCTIEVTTDQNLQGHYCHGLKSKDVSINDNNISIDLDLIGEVGSGDNEQ